MTFYPETSPEIICMRLLRRLQQRNRFVTYDLNLPLTITQSFILLEVAAGRNSAGDLAGLFDVEQSTMSRNLAGLVRSGYLHMQLSIQDARKRIIALTDAGRRFVQEYNRASNQQISQYSFLIAAGQRKEFENYFTRFNDAICSPKLHGHSGDSPIRKEMRRIIFGIGGFKKSFMNSDLSIAEWQVLSELVYRNCAMSQSEIARKTGATQSSLPALVKRLSAAGFLKNKARKDDARVRDIVATANSIKKIKQIEQAFAELFSRAFVALGKDKGERFLKLFELFVGETVRGNPRLSENLYCKPVQDSAVLKELRALLLRRIISEKKFDFVPSKLFDPASSIWAVYDNNDSIVGGIEFVREGKKTAIINLLLPEDCEQAVVLSALMQVAEIDKDSVV